MQSVTSLFNPKIAENENDVGNLEDFETTDHLDPQSGQLVASSEISDIASKIVNLTKEVNKKGKFDVARQLYRLYSQFFCSMFALTIQTLQLLQHFNVNVGFSRSSCPYYIFCF